MNKNIKKEALVWITVGGVIGIWVLVLYLTGTPLAINDESLKKLPDVVTIYVVLAFIFTQWLRKLPFLQGWLVPYPNLNGTWQGTVKSTWVSPETNESVTVPALFVVKQSFSSISCVILTAESESYSTAAQINDDDESGIFRLSHNYMNTSRSSVRERSQVHYGAAVIKIVKVPKKLLEGEYWTDRKTTGEMRFDFKSNKHFQSFISPDEEISNGADSRD
jgi:hypothetical protein